MNGPLLVTYLFSDQIDNLGKMSNSLNALFSGLAFAGLVFAILLQRRELELQREELDETGETLRKQNFESSFFQLLGNHSALVEGMTIRRGADGDYYGRDAFRYLRGKLGLAYGVASLQTEGDGEIDLDSEMNCISKIYDGFFEEYQPYIGHYFRNLYHIVKFVHENPYFSQAKSPSDRKTYTSLARAQLSSDELTLLFYNCLVTRNHKFKLLIEKYALLESMRFPSLLNKSHVFLYCENAYGDSLPPDWDRHNS